MKTNKTKQSSSLLALDLRDPTSVANFATSLFTRRASFKYALERQWYLNIAWFMGRQNVFWNETTLQLSETVVPSWRVRLVINMMFPHLRALISKFIRDNPEWDIIPSTSDDADIQTAMMDKQVLEYRWNNLNLEDRWAEALVWAMLTGNGFLKTFWNSEKGDCFSIAPDDMLPQMFESADAKAAAIKDIQSKFKHIDFPYNEYMGDTDVKVVSPFEMLVDPKATSIDDALWTIESTVDYVDVIKDKYGKLADGIVPDENAVLADRHFNSNFKLKKLFGANSNVSSGNLEEQDELAVIHELYIKPTGSKKFKDGLFAVICQDKILNNGGEPIDFPYSHGQLPYVHAREIIVPGQFWGISTAEQLIAPQSELNKTRSQLIENRNLMGKPKWKVSKNSGVLGSAITSEPGEVIEINAGAVVEPIAPPPMPAYITEMAGLFKQDMEDISGQHEVARADAPGEVRSGRGILALIEQDESITSLTDKGFNSQLARLGKLVICTDTQFVDEDRTGTIIGDDDELMLFTWSGRNMLGYGRPGWNYFDVRLSTIPGMPTGRIAQSAYVDNLLERNVLDPVKDRALILKLLNLGRAERIVDKARVHRSKAVRENLLLEKGQQVAVFEWQDHEAHLDVHHNYMNSLKYEELPDEVKQAYIIHCQQHKTAAALVAAEPDVLLRKAVQTLMMKQGMVQDGQEIQQPQQQPGPQVPQGV